MGWPPPSQPAIRHQLSGSSLQEAAPALLFQIRPHIPRRGREALTLEVSEQGATHMAHSDVGVQACPRYQYQIVRAAD